MAASAFVNVTDQEIDEYYEEFTNMDDGDVRIYENGYDSDGCESNGGFESEDDLVFFLGDSGDEDSEEDEVEEIAPKVITQLSPDTAEKMKILDGKLIWADKDFEPVTLLRSEN